MKTLEFKDYENIARWSSIYWTWWWLKFDEQIDKSKSLTSEVILKSLDEIDDDEYVASMYAIWAAWSDIEGATETITSIIDKVESDLWWKLTWIFPVEVSIESLVAEICAKSNIFLIDADACGWRAVPEATYDNFYLYNKNVTPVYYWNKNWINMILWDIWPKELDSVLRESVEEYWWSVFCVDHIWKAWEMKKYLSLWTISRSMKLWEKIKSSKNSLWDILENSNIQVIDTCEVWEVNLNRAKWFFWGEVQLNTWNKTYKIKVQNEYMQCFDDKWELLINFPDLIMLLNNKTKKWVHSTDLKSWMSVTLCSKKAEERWQWFEYTSK